MLFDRQPTLISDLMALRPLLVEDFDALYAVASDPEIWQLHPAKNRWQEAEFRKFFDAAIKSGGALLVIDKNTNRVIGSSRYHNYDRENNQIEIGWTFLGREWWGGKYNREMKRLMLTHAFQTVSGVVFIVGKENYRSQAAVLKIGALPIADRRDTSGITSCAYLLNKRAFVEVFK